MESANRCEILRQRFRPALVEHRDELFDGRGGSWWPARKGIQPLAAKKRSPFTTLVLSGTSVIGLRA